MLCYVCLFLFNIVSFCMICIDFRDHMTYVEQDCFGKGYDVSKRVTWSQHNLSENEMQPYTKANFIQDGWLTTQPEMNY